MPECFTYWMKILSRSRFAADTDTTSGQIAARWSTDVRRRHPCRIAAVVAGVKGPRRRSDCWNETIMAIVTRPDDDDGGRQGGDCLNRSAQCP